MAKSFVNISPYRFHWAMCTHMPSLKGNVRSPLGTEAVQWIAKHAECSQEDAVKIFDSAYKAGAIISAAGKFRGDWKELLDRNADKWSKKIKAGKVITPKDGTIPDGEHDFTVKSAKDLENGLSLTLLVHGYAQSIDTALDGAEKFTIDQFLLCTGHNPSQGIDLTVETVVGWKGRLWLEGGGIGFVTGNTGDED